MNWEALGAIAEFIGGIAVLLTLIYLAIQVRQTNQMARETILRHPTDRNMDNSKLMHAGHDGYFYSYHGRTTIRYQGGAVALWKLHVRHVPGFPGGLPLQ